MDSVSSKECQITSMPIKVISKPSQLQKKRKETDTPSIEQPAPKMKRASSPQKTKRANSPPRDEEELQQTLRRMEEINREQTKVIQQLLEKSSPLPQPSQNMDLDFEITFHRFISCFQKIPREEREKKSLSIHLQWIL